MLRGSVVTALLGVLVATGASLTGGFLAPRALEQNTREFNEGVKGAAKLETLEFEQGLLTSRALSRLTSRFPARTFLIEHRIEHTPWTPFQRAAAVHVTSWMWKETGGSRADSDAPIAELRTRIVLPQVVYSTFEVASNPLEGSGEARWKDLRGSFQAVFKKQSGELSIESLELGQGAGKLRIGKLELGADGELRGEDVKILGIRSRAENVAMQDMGSKPGEFESFELRMAERADGELLGYDVRLDMRGMTSPQGKLDEMVIDVALEHISPELRDAFEDRSEPPDPSVLLPLMSQAALLSPKLVVRELRMKGRMDVPIDLAASGSVRIDGERFSNAGGDLQALPECIDADMELRLAEEFLVETMSKPFAGRGSQSVDAKRMTDGFLQAGYFERDGTYLQSRLRMRGVKSLMLNGQALDQAIARFASFKQQAQARSASSVPAAAEDADDSTHVWQGSPQNNSELDEMRRQMGLK
jgi:hypothetical protein